MCFTVRASFLEETPPEKHIVLGSGGLGVTITIFHVFFQNSQVSPIFFQQSHPPKLQVLNFTSLEVMLNKPVHYKIYAAHNFHHTLIIKFLPKTSSIIHEHELILYHCKHHLDESSRLKYIAPILHMQFTVIHLYKF